MYTLYTCIYTIYTCIYTIYTPNTPLNTLYAPYIHLHTPLHGRYLIFEYLEQDLKQLLSSKGPNGLPPATVRRYTFELMSGICYCHLNRVLHRDIKPENILITNNGQLKLADFGLAREFGIPIRRFTHEVRIQLYQ